MTVGGNRAYAGMGELPTLVRSAIAEASRQHFDHSCAPEQGRLLSVLARGFIGGRIGETGTGCGVGLAWMVEATDASTALVSIEADATRSTTSATLFADRANVRVLHGDWTALREHGPFDLLVLDGGGKGKEPADDPPLDPTDGWLALGGNHRSRRLHPGRQLGGRGPRCSPALLAGPPGPTVHRAASVPDPGDGGRDPGPLTVGRAHPAGAAESAFTMFFARSVRGVAVPPLCR
jgi:hypothetical protein